MFEGFSDALGNNTLTMSGEIIISVVPGVNMGVIHTFDRSEYKNVLKRMKAAYRFLKIEQHDGLSEINVKIFALKQPCGNDNFLDAFNDDLVELVKAILVEESLYVRLNIFGEFCDGKVIKKYRYLNKRDDVRYKITDEEELSGSDKFATPRVKACLLALATVAVVVYQGYLYWQENYSDDAKGKEKTEQAAPKDKKIEDKGNNDKSENSRGKGTEKKAGKPDVKPSEAKPDQGSSKTSGSQSEKTSDKGQKSI